MLIHNARQRIGPAIGVPASSTNARLQYEYLIAENLRFHLTEGLQLTDTQRFTLVGIAKRLGWKHLPEVACVAQPFWPGIVVWLPSNSKARSIVSIPSPFLAPFFRV
jgi:hypothetical protein